MAKRFVMSDTKYKQVCFLINQAYCKVLFLWSMPSTEGFARLRHGHHVRRDQFTQFLTPCDTCALPPRDADEKTEMSYLPASPCPEPLFLKE